MSRELNIVSGGYVACPACEERLTRVHVKCSHCSAPIDLSDIRIVHTPSRRRRRRFWPSLSALLPKPR